MNCIGFKRCLGKYIHNNLKALDQLLNSITGGDEDELVSSRLGKAKAKGSKFALYFCKLLDIVFFWQDGDHCHQSIEKDEGENDLFTGGG